MEKLKIKYMCLRDVFRKNREEYIKSLARDNTQLLINTLWKVRML